MLLLPFSQIVGYVMLIKISIFFGQVSMSCLFSIDSLITCFGFVFANKMLQILTDLILVFINPDCKINLPYVHYVKKILKPKLNFIF